MDLKALKLLLLLVGNKFRLRIPLGELHTAKKCGQPFIADVCKSKRVDHTPQRSADSHLWLAFAEQTY